MIPRQSFANRIYSLKTISRYGVPQHMRVVFASSIVNFITLVCMCVHLFCDMIMHWNVCYVDVTS